MGQVTSWLTARVPGCVHSDLLANGTIEDPYYEMNSLKCEWVSNRWWVYKTEFCLDPSLANQTIELVFLGVDYKCHIFLNNEKLLEHEGMFEPFRIDLGGKVRFGCSNVLEVILESAPDEMGQIGHTSLVKTQKSRFGYKWDFSTRLVHTGIWQDVSLHVFPAARIKNTRVTTALDGHHGIVEIESSLLLSREKHYCLSAKLSLGENVVAESNCVTEADTHEDDTFKMKLLVENPEIWWPNGHGKQPLYEVEIRLLQDDEVCDSFQCKTGIRSLGYGCNDGAEDALPYVPIFNGKRVYIKGVNMTPLDHMIGAIFRERYAKMLKLAKDANVNLIRVWGGGIIEKEVFYDLCDAYGIMVWQEFNQSSSGIDNVPPTDSKYLELLGKNADAAILSRRNHTSLTFWSGGNELMDTDGVPASYSDENIAMLKRLVNRLDPERLFLPTSASGPSEFLNTSPEGLTRNHDVHGPWQYQGVEKHYDIYNRSDSLLHSEFGVDGFTNINAIDSFLSQENQRLSNMGENLVWRHHGEWWDTTSRDRDIFGEPENMEALVRHSQYIQAEGLRYAIEANRRRAFQNCGSIIWQLNEPWPNLSCTSIVDFTMAPKIAYDFVKRAYAPLSVSLTYDKLGYKPGEMFESQVWIADDACSFDGLIAYRVLDTKQQILHQGMLHAVSDGRHAAPAGEISFSVAEWPAGLFVIELAIVGMCDEYTNRYLFSHNDSPIFSTVTATFLAFCQGQGYAK